MGRGEPDEAEEEPSPAPQVEEEKAEVVEPTAEVENPAAAPEAAEAPPADEGEAEEKPGEAQAAAPTEGEEQLDGEKGQEDKKEKKKDAEGAPDGEEVGGGKKPEKSKNEKGKKGKKKEPSGEDGGGEEPVAAEGDDAPSTKKKGKGDKKGKKGKAKAEPEEEGGEVEPAVTETDGEGEMKPKKGKGKDKESKKSKGGESGQETAGEEPEPKEKKKDKKGKEKVEKAASTVKIIDEATTKSTVEIVRTAKSEKSLSRITKSAKSQKSVLSTLEGDEQRVKFKKPKSPAKKSEMILVSDELDDEYSSSSGSYDETEFEETKKVKKGKEKKGKKKAKDKESKDTLEPVVEEEKVEGDVEEPVAKPEKGKKDKGKKGKKGKDEAPPPEEEAPKEEDDIMAELKRMKMAAEGEEVVEAVEEKPKKKEKKAKKKKAKVKVTPEMLEKMRIEQEAEAARLALLEKQRLEEERLAAIEKDKREVIEQQMRLEQLNRSAVNVGKIIEYNMKLAEQEKKLMEWELYIACGKLPNPSLCDQMNTYLHRWQISMDTTTVDDASQRTADVVSLLDSLQDLLDTAEHEDEKKIENYKWIRQLFRDQQQDSLDVATYRLLRNVEKNLNRVDIPTADFNFWDEHMSFSIWLRVILPIPLPNPRRPPKARLDINFENIKLQALFPLSIECEGMAIRAMYLKYDYLSDLCSSFDTPEVPEEITKSLLDVTKQEWRTKQKYKFENRDIIPVVETTPEIPDEEPPSEIDESKVPESDREKEEEKTDVEVKEEVEEEIPLVPYKKLTPTASEFAISIEDEIYFEARKSYRRLIPEGALNLRKFSVIGGVFHLNLLYQPPQPQHYVTMDLNLTCLYIPKKLETVPFMVSYTPPKPTEPGVRKQPEEIEEEMKRQEEELDKLICITLTWPDDVIFLEPPIICQWDPEQKHWMKNNIHDVKPNEDNCMISFRTGSFGVIGLATIRYVNLPYQAWELKPEEDGTVTLNITAAILMLEFNVKGGLICLSDLQNSPSNALLDIVGEYMKLFKLKRLMKEAGVDVFPEPDAFLYVDGSCEKHWPMEKHLYFCMARMCGCFNFAWSRWNLTAGRRNIVMQMRDYTPGSQKQKSHMMCLVTPLKATYINCTEMSPAFTDEDIENLKFTSDLFNLMKSTTGIAIRKKVQAACFELQYAVSQLLILTRVFSFS